MTTGHRPGLPRAAPIGRRRDGPAYHAAMPDDVRSRLLEGTYACVVRQGIGGTFLEDAAREAGVSRATLYRYFPGGRDELMGAVIMWETLRFFQDLAEAVSGAPDLETLLVDGVLAAH